MILIKPSWEILEQKNDLYDVFRQIELAGRTCYKSNAYITENSALKFVDRLIQAGHTAALEHGTIYLYLKIDYSSFTTKEIDYLEDLISKYQENKYSKVLIQTTSTPNKREKEAYITTNYRVIIENNWSADLCFLCAPKSLHYKRYTVKFICDRAIANEIVRHRSFSFMQESTRYCNYTLDKFGNELTFIEPLWLESSSKKDVILKLLKNVELHYFDLLNSKEHSPQEARDILPLCLKTELIVTGFAEDWIHFFDLRALDKTGKAHPEIHRLVDSLYKSFKERNYIY